MDYSDIKDWLEMSRTGLELLKGARDMLPKGEKRSEVDAKIRSAEDVLRRADARLAKELGYELCQCEFPPRIMLWREGEQSHVCTNEACGRKIKSFSAYDLPKRDFGWLA